MKKSVYLAGPIHGQTYKSASGWRSDAATLFKEMEVDVWDPFRGYRSLRHKGADVLHHTDIESIQGVSNAAAMTRDLEDINRADLVLMNLSGVDKVSIGTMVELGWAAKHRTPVISILLPGEIHDHPFVREMTHVTESLRDGIDLARFMLCPSDWG